MMDLNSREDVEVMDLWLFVVVEQAVKQVQIEVMN